MDSSRDGEIDHVATDQGCKVTSCRWQQKLLVPLLPPSGPLTQYSSSLSLKADDGMDYFHSPSTGHWDQEYLQEGTQTSK